MSSSWVLSANFSGPMASGFSSSVLDPSDAAAAGVARRPIAPAPAAIAPVVIQRGEPAVASFLALVDFRTDAREAITSSWSHVPWGTAPARWRLGLVELGYVSFSMLWAMDLSFTPARFDDLDQFREHSLAMGWDLDSIQLSRGANRIVYDHLAFPEIMVARYAVKKRLRDRFALPNGFVVLLICREKLPIVWCGRELPPSLLGIVRSGREHSAVIPDGWDCYEFTISEELIGRTELFPADVLARTNRLEDAFLPLPEPETRQFLQQLDAVFRATEGATPLQAAVDGTECYDLILQGLQRMIDAGLAASRPSRPRRVRRFDLVMSADELMNDLITTDLTADEIAQLLGVSHRVLSYAFQDSLGVSPYRYFSTKRLHAVRRTLRAGAASVTDASTAHGFYTPGRFSAQYKRLFAELPSETLRRALGREPLVSERSIRAPR